MANPLLQLTLTIDEEQIGRLLVAALALNARIDALGLVEAVPYTRNVPSELKHLVPKKLGRPRIQPVKPAGETPEEFLARKKHAREALVEAIAAAGSEGLDREAGRKVYGAAGGDLRGFGNVARNYAIEKRKRLFPLPPTPEAR